MLTADKVLDNAFIKAIMGGSDHPGMKLERPVRTRDAVGNWKTHDTSGGFLVGELERLDQTFHGPLFTYTYTRDLDMRTDVTTGDEVSSFTQSTFATPGGPGNGSATGQKRSFIGKVSTQLPTLALDIDKIEQPLVPWGSGVEYSLPELRSAAQLGRPVDQQKILALNDNYQLESDAQAYLGWTGNNTTGLINNPTVPATNLPNAAAGGGGAKWSGGTKQPTEIITDLTNMLYAPWAASGFAVMPNRILLDPQNYSFISTQLVSTGGGTTGAISILAYFLQSNIAKNSGEDLRVLPLKWLTGAGAGGTLMQQGTTNRGVVYHKSYDRVRFPMTMLERTPIQFDGLWHKMYWWGRMGTVEFVYPETAAYFDGM